MTDLKQAAQQALEALKSAAIFVDSFRGQKATQDAITALQAALEQQAEPIGWLDGNDKLAEFMHRDLKAEHDKRGSATPREFTVPVYSALPQRKPLTDGLEIKVKRELFRFHSEQEWVNKAQSWYAKCGVRKGHYVTVDALGHVMHMGLCFRHATFPVTCYELQTNWPNQSAAHGIKEQP